jgi:twinkle protein
MVGVSTMTNPAMEWLDKRGLDIELAAKMGLELVHHRELGPSVKIPFVRDGAVVTTQYRALDRKEFRFATGSSVELWNCDALKYDEDKPVILAEGVCDALALMQCGFPRVVAVPGWSDKNFDPDTYAPFKQHEEAIRASGNIIVAMHNDSAGKTMLRATAAFFDNCEVAYTVWPRGCKDANDTLLMHGQEAVVAAVTRCKVVDPLGGVITGFSDLPPRPDRQIWRLDFPGLDKAIAFRQRAISALTGVPGSGKTTFAIWCSHHLVRNHGMRVGLALFETEAEEALYQLARLNGKEPAFMNDDEWTELKEKLDLGYRVCHRVAEKDPKGDGEVAHGMAWLKSMLWKLATRDQCSVVFVDPWNELEHQLEPGESLTNYINFALTKMRQWAEQLGIHICIIAHPRKLQIGERVTGYQISDSAAWANKVDMGWTVHCEKDKVKNEEGNIVGEEEYVSLHCWKVRSRQGTGCRPGTVKLLFDENTMSYKLKPKGDTQ